MSAKVDVIKQFVPPRSVCDRDSRYMGLAWIQAGFSKDPSTQVGACIVDSENRPLGWGYNGPPKNIDDHSFSWERPPIDDPDAFSKYDAIDHAEENCIEHCFGASLVGATMYVTALPCPRCMKMLVRKEFKRVVYFDYQSEKSSMLQNAKWRDKSFKLASLGKVKVDLFNGNINWLLDWIHHLDQLNIFDTQHPS